MAQADRQKLRTVLGYWIKHNREHAQEFKEWADKAVAMGEPDVADDIREAGAETDKVTRLLSSARQKLGKKEG